MHDVQTVKFLLSMYFIIINITLWQIRTMSSSVQSPMYVCVSNFCSESLKSYLIITDNYQGYSTTRLQHRDSHQDQISFSQYSN